MPNKTVTGIENAIAYIEKHLDGKVDLESVADAVHYSKYHLHRMFTATVGMTLHDYVQRRQLTEAAKLLVFSNKPVLDIAMTCGYESQQAFTNAFRSMYKTPPAKYRENQVFYPLQLRFALHKKTKRTAIEEQSICIAKRADIPAWMDLMRLAIDGYPAMNEEEYLTEITRRIDEKRALVLYSDDFLVGALAFSTGPCCIDYMGIHPQYRNAGIQKMFLNALLTRFAPGEEISMTTYREDDKADTGHRDLLKQLGFAERELLVEFGYPTQRFVLPLQNKEEEDE